MHMFMWLLKKEIKDCRLATLTILSVRVYHSQHCVFKSSRNIVCICAIWSSLITPQNYNAAVSGVITYSV